MLDYFEWEELFNDIQMAVNKWDCASRRIDMLKCWVQNPMPKEDRTDELWSKIQNAFVEVSTCMEESYKNTRSELRDIYNELYDLFYKGD